jgi:hypothetical protein
MRRLLSCCVLVPVCLGSVVAAPRMGRGTAGAELSPQASEALQVLITTAADSRITLGKLTEGRSVPSRVWPPLMPVHAVRPWPPAGQGCQSPR